MKTVKIFKKLGLGLPVDSKGNRPSKARSWEDWDAWRAEMKKDHAFLYWLNDTLPSYHLPLKWKVERATDWVRYRTTRRFHVVETGCEPNYMEPYDRMFHASFNILKDFVEKEKALIQCVFSDNPIDKKHRNLKKNGRELGLKYLAWEKTLDNSDEHEHCCSTQAESAREIEKLYLWWVDERPKREDPWDNPERKKYEEEYRKMEIEIYGDDKGIFRHSKDTPEMQKLFGKMTDVTTAMEIAYDKEDEEMFIRLIKIRKDLWT